jgi:hypothetical protein
MAALLQADEFRINEVRDAGSEGHPHIHIIFVSSFQ